MRFVALAGAAAILAACATTPTASKHAAVTDDEVGRFIALNRLEPALGLMQAALAQREPELREQMGPEVAAAVLYGVDRDAMVERARAWLGRELQPERLHALFAFLASPLGRLYRASTEIAEKGDPDALRKALETLHDRPDFEARVAAARRLEAALRMTEVRMELPRQSTLAIARVLLYVQGLDTPENVQAVERKLREGEDDPGDVRAAMVVSVLYGLREASVAQMDGLADFFSSETGRWFVEMRDGALAASIDLVHERAEAYLAEHAPGGG